MVELLLSVMIGGERESGGVGPCPRGRWLRCQVPTGQAVSWLRQAGAAADDG